MREIISIILSVMLVAFGVVTPATSETANPSMNFVYADSMKANVAIYKIHGNNFYKLRDVCQPFDVGGYSHR